MSLYICTMVVKFPIGDGLVAIISIHVGPPSGNLTVKGISNDGG